LVFQKAGQIEKQTTGQKLDVSSIKLNMENKTFSINKGSTSVLKLVLRWNMPGETTCISCDNTINKNPEYKPKKLEGGIFRIDGDDEDRIYSLIVLYSKPKINS
jgi:hypothetical protein